MPTFLFTRVEGSTKLLHEVGAKTYAEALAEHRRICERRAPLELVWRSIADRDAFFRCFPQEALEAARALTEPSAEITWAGRRRVA